MILIVDDNQYNLYSLKKLLVSNHFEVDTAESGQDALSKALVNQYSLIILDVQMPYMDGFEVAEALSGYSKTQKIPIIFLSAVNTEKEFITKGYESGGIDYVTKPIDPEILLLKVKTFYNMQEENLAMQKNKKNLEQEVKGRKADQQNMKLKINQFHQMLEALPQIAFTLNEEGKIDFVNNKWHKYSLSEKEFPETPEEDNSINDEFLKIKTTAEELHSEIRIKNIKTNEFRYHLLRISPIWEGKKTKGWVGTFTDVDDQRRVQREKDEFLSIASHELKTPLTSIKAYVQILDRKLNLKEGSPESLYVSKVQDQIEKLNLLIIDLLDISKIENGKLKINKQPESLEKVINNAIDTIILTQSKDKIKIKRHGNLPENNFSFDAMRIEQVLINFLTNAVKYSPKNNEIIITTFTDEDQVKVSVTDFGIGIPDYKIDSVFKKFYRVEESSEQFQGLGLGLYICKEIIQQHKGKIGVSSIINEGSTFYFTLPLN